MSAVWREIPGFDGAYEVSDNGRIRTVHAHPKGRTPAGHVMKPRLHENGYLNVGLRRGKRRVVVGVHRLVATAFHGEPQPGWEARHLDGDKTNNAASNLRWGTHSDNVRDSVAAGTHYSHGRAKTVCKNGHEFSPENTRHFESNGEMRRECRACRLEISRRARRRAALRNNGGVQQ